MCPAGTGAATRSQSSRFWAKSRSEERLVTAVTVPRLTQHRSACSGVSPCSTDTALALGLELAKQLDLPAPTAGGNSASGCDHRGDCPQCIPWARTHSLQKNRHRERICKMVYTNLTTFALYPAPALSYGPPQLANAWMLPKYFF